VRKLAILLTVAVVVAAAWTSVFTVSEREMVIVSLFGDPKRIVEDAGLKLKAPFGIHQVIRIDRRMNVFETQVIQLMLKDRNPVIVTCYVTWRVEDPLPYYQSLGDRTNAELKLGDLINSEMGSVLGQYNLEDVINTEADAVKLDEIEQQLVVNIADRASGTFGIDVARIGIRRLSYPPIVSKAVFDRMKAEREKEASRHRAEGKEKAAEIEAETDREVSEILATAYRDAEVIKGEGDSEAMRIYAEAYGQDQEFFLFLRSLEAYEQVLDENSTVVLSTDADLFRYLESMEGR
jgi:modulator of FtsH protease HflC